MDHITNINRERNKQIIKQAQELNSLLLDNGIRPLFLKGTGNLLAGLYEDIAERMVGDIDFIFSKEDYSKAIVILRESGYSELEKADYYYPVQKHYRKIIKQNALAAIEIHKEVMTKKFNNELIILF